ncbi:treslin [Callorhinchus milii]|uniref:treslin n=1 Tax=Callorhinchus milii TaxID=7868 RepID=UPI001C3F5D81|nr:treslin [Callorhinchus milii]
MASRSLVFLLDSRGDGAGPGLGLAARRSCLRLLTRAACGFGFQRVRWGFRLFPSGPGGSRGPGLGRDFRELRPSDLRGLEEALGRQAEARAAGPSGAAAIQAALREALSDYQWDRPDLTSPAKRGRGRRRAAEEDGQPRDCKALFLCARCPHSRAELLRFLGPGHSEQPLADSLLPPGLRALLTGRGIGLHWLDTSPPPQFTGAPDHIGYRMISEVLQLVGGNLIPFAALLQLSYVPECERLLEDPGFGKPTVQQEEGAEDKVRDRKEYMEQRRAFDAVFPFDCSMNYFMSDERLYRSTFPVQEGLLTITQGDQKESCSVTLEPVSSSQKYLPGPVNIAIRGAVKDWDPPKANLLSTHSWILQWPESRQTAESSLLQQLLQKITHNRIYLVTDVALGDGLPLGTGILSPLLGGATLLTLICSQLAVEFEECFSQTKVTESVQGVTSELLGAVERAINFLSEVLEDTYESSEVLSACEGVAVPHWVRQELAQGPRHGACFAESWFPLSELSGASSVFIESFRSTLTTDEAENTEQELALTSHLAEMYQRQAAEEAGAATEYGRKKTGIPRTPLRQKMKSMSRSLQMLNVARLNVKAQKCQPEATPLPVTEPARHQAKRRLEDKREIKRRVKKRTIDFKNDEELMSSLEENYQKHVVEEELSQLSFVQNTVTIVHTYLQSGSAEQFEAKCINLIQTHLLKTSKSIRQQYGNQENKDTKVRDCQLQVLLRLEMCQQCPSLQSSAGDLVEEMTNLLRIISLTKDTTFLAKFLEEDILSTYLLVLPQILGELYYGMGQSVPACLASVLPADFFSDESMSQESESPSNLLMSSLPLDTACTDAPDTQLDELRTRSSRKRRSIPLTRHRSISEVSHNLRQIQMPKKPLRLESLQSRTFVVEQPLPPPPVPNETQEVTKVRRNLFNQEMLSPRKKSKMRRTQSVSAVEGRNHQHRKEKASNVHRKLLTKKVCETPLHKQVSHRLLHRQIRGRCSESGSDISVVEESPEKSLSTEPILRRSPRFQKASLTKRHSISFYGGSQPTPHSGAESRTQGAEEPGGRTLRSPRPLFDSDLVPPPGRQRLWRSCSGSDSCQPAKTLKQLRSPPRSKTPQKSPRALHNSPLTPGKSVKASKSPMVGKVPVRRLDKRTSSWETGSDCQFQAPQRREHINTAAAPNRKNSVLQLGICSPSSAGGNEHVSLASPHKVHFLPRRSLRLASPCRDSSAVDISAVSSETLNFASPVKTQRKGRFVLSSPAPKSKEIPSSVSMDSSLSISPAMLSTSVKAGQWKSKLQVSSTPHMPANSFTSPQKRPCTPRTLQSSPEELGVSPERKEMLQISHGVHVKSLWNISPPSLRKLQVRTRSMLMKTSCKANAESPKQVNPPQTRSSSRITPSEAAIKTPSKFNTTPSQSSVRTLSIFTVTPSKDAPRPPRCITTPPQLKAPVRTRSWCEVASSSEADVRTWDRARPTARAPLRPKVRMSGSEKLVVSVQAPVTPAAYTSSRSEQSLVTSLHRRCGKCNVQSSQEPSATSEVKAEGASGIVKDSCFGNVVPGETAAESLHCGETKPTACKRWPKEMSGRSKHLGKSCFHAASVLDTSYSGLLSQTAVGDLMSDVSLVSERLDSSSLASTTDSGAASSQAEESSDILDAQLALDECADLQIRFTELLNTDTSDSVPSAHPHTHTSPTPYEFRWTPDRRQRLAAAMQRTSEVPRKIHPSQTPMAQHLLPIPTYKVELEMQDSGLPKLRFKRTNSVCVPQEESSVPKDSETGFCVRKSGCQSPPADGTPGCAKHAGHISPSICLHSSHSTPAKATPGKGGVQTFICQSYTPTRCSSTTSSPSQAEPGTVPWTPSPTQKSKPSQTPDAIKNWPRKKKAAHTPWSGDKGEYIASENDVESHSEHYSNKTMPLEEIGMEGVSRLPDQSPGAEREWRSQEGSSQSFGLRSRKRGRSSPGGELDRPAKTQRVDLTAVSSMDVGSVLQGKAKEHGANAPFPKPFLRQGSGEEEDFFHSPAVTPPAGKVRTGLSVSSLLALTQSPMLYQGRTSSAKKRSCAPDGTGEESDPENCPGRRPALTDCASPFTEISARRCITKTYSRKKLLH